MIDRSPMSDHEVEIIKEAWGYGASQAEVSRILNAHGYERSRHVVRWKLYSLGLLERPLRSPVVHKRGAAIRPETPLSRPRPPILNFALCERILSGAMGTNHERC